MKPVAEKKIQKYFEKINSSIYWPSDLSTLLDRKRSDWGTNASTTQIINFLLEKHLLKRAEFKSPKYGRIVRYFRGQLSPFRFALSLRRNSFLCHQTALVLHGFPSSSKTVYVNKEQSDKPESAARLTQDSIRSAFSRQQRLSNYQFQRENWRYVLISGKNTDRAGVIPIPTGCGETLDSTDLERTLIDIVVRPAYAGGLLNMVEVYKKVAHTVDVAHLIDLLKTLNYLYPYAQSIGFLLERAGRTATELTKLEDLRSNFDFFLDYGLKDPSYNEKWRLFHPF